MPRAENGVRSTCPCSLRLRTEKQIGMNFFVRGIVSYEEDTSDPEMRMNSNFVSRTDFEGNDIRKERGVQDYIG